MIVVTRLNDSQFAINPDLIERIHVNPDTTLVMVDGAKFIVTESLAEVIEKIAAYRAHVIGLAYRADPYSADPHSADPYRADRGADHLADRRADHHADSGRGSHDQAAGDPDTRSDAVVPLRPRRM